MPPADRVSDCHECSEELEHCHGTAVLHPDGSVECLLDPGCVLPAGPHAATIPCEELVPVCRCA